MTKEFVKAIFEKHKEAESFPATSEVCKLATKVLLTLFPEQSRRRISSESDLLLVFDEIKNDLRKILSTIKEYLNTEPEDISTKFMEYLPIIHEELSEDALAILTGDPAAKSEYEVIRAYPGFYGIAFYRIANALYRLNVPMLPRVITEFAHSKTGIDIHPGATIAPGFFIDHGTGIVIGETVVIGKNVKLYQGVTLGALSVSKEMASLKRHPTIEENVVIYANATILGGETVIGKDSIIGGNVWLTKSVAPQSRIYHNASIKVL